MAVAAQRGSARITPRRSRIACCLIVLSPVLLWTLVGCTDSEARSGAAPTEPPSKADIDKWVMPLDTYIEFSPELHDYVEGLLVGECLIEAGYEWPVPGRAPDFSWPANYNEVGHRLFDVGIAERFGYHDAPATDPQWVLAQESFVLYTQSYAPSPDFSDTYDGCLRSAQAEHTSPRFADDYNTVASLKNDAYEAAKSDPRVVATLDDWSECVAGVLPGVSDPLSVLSDQSRAEKFGLWGDTRTQVPSLDERTVAVKDAECQVSSGYAAAFYGAQWDREFEASKLNEVELARIKSDGAEHARHLIDLFTQYAPPAGETL